jgi:hypothetical protein
MLRAEDRQRRSETEIGQGDDFVHAAGFSEVALYGQQADQEKHDAGGAGGDDGAGDFEESEENVHVSVRRSDATWRS